MQSKKQRAAVDGSTDLELQTIDNLFNIKNLLI